MLKVIWLQSDQLCSKLLKAALPEWLEHYQFGFHWNNTRKCWQHPCSQFATEGSGADPRQKYGSRFAADLKAA